MNLPDHGASARESRARARARSRQVQGPDTPYILEELSELDAKNLPDPISADQKKIIMDRAHDSYHQPVVDCSVCNQFCSLSATELLLPCELPPAVFTVLQPSPEAEPLSAELLAQYDISRAFLAAPEVSFSSAIEGVVYDSHEADFAHDSDGDLPEACSDGSCACSPRVRICNECLSSLKAGNRPTKSIANGNFWGKVGPAGVRRHVVRFARPDQARPTVWSAHCV